MSDAKEVAAKVARSVQAHVSRALRGASADTRRDVIDACVAALRALEHEEPIPAPPAVAPSPSLAPPARATPHHLVFLVHGMGRHDDFDDAKQLGHDGKPGTGGGNAEFREALDTALGGRAFKEFEATRVAVRSVEWHSLLRSAGLEKVLDACCPSGVPELRDFAKQNLLDILLFSSTDKAQALFYAGSDEMKEGDASTVRPDREHRCRRGARRGASAFFPR